MIYRAVQAWARLIDYLTGGRTKRRLVVLELEARHAKDAYRKVLGQNRDLAARLDALENLITGTPS